jgi:hypothetical protein
MTSFLEEEVPPVNPLGIKAIEELGRCFLEQLAPETLQTPQPLQVSHLVDAVLPRFGMLVYPAEREELGHRDGATDPQGDGEVVILVTEAVWDGLELAPPQSHYARTTVCHEIGHAVLHVPVLRRRLQVTDVLARMQRGKLPAYMDPEWQAWAFAGAILMPSVALKQLQAQHPTLTPQLVSQTFEVSLSMAASHLRRLKWPQC